MERARPRAEPPPAGGGGWGFTHDHPAADLPVPGTGTFPARPVRGCGTGAPFPGPGLSCALYWAGCILTLPPSLAPLHCSQPGGGVVFSLSAIPNGGEGRGEVAR